VPWDDPVDIARRDVIDHLDVSCPRVDGNVGGVRAVRRLRSQKNVPSDCRFSGARSVQLTTLPSGDDAIPASRIMSSAAQFRRRAAAARMAFFRFSAASMMAEPPITVEREPNEPKPACRYVVEP
jgi:hypothetical protein